MRSKILFSVLAILLVFFLASGTAAAADPIEIRTLADLMAIDDPVNLHLDYILMNDIDVGSEETDTLKFMPIGGNTNLQKFTGTFDGNGYTISNITLTTTIRDYHGLFGLTQNASISNLHLENVCFHGYNNIGSLIGYAENTSIDNCSVVNTYLLRISGTNYIGGFVGAMRNSSISNSYTTSSVKGYGSNVGGFVGFMDNCSISNSYATGFVTGPITNPVPGNVGGFVGQMSDSVISNSYATGNAEGSVSHGGGFVGFMVANSSIFNSYATGNATGTGNNIGGFVGALDDSTVIDSFYIGSPGSNDDSKGFFIDSGDLKKMATFTTLKDNGGYVSKSWSISSSPNSNSIWYINEGNSYPQLNWNDAVSTSYTVTFNSAGGTAIPPQTVNDGDRVIQPENPEKDGFTFVEWQWNDVAYDFSKPVTEDLTLTATYKPVIVSHTVTFNSNGGTDVPSQMINDGDLVIQPENPEKDGFTFVEWQWNDVAYDFSKPVTEDLTLNAIYKPVVVSHTVIFNSDGGTVISPQTINDGDSIIQPEDPEKDSFTFVEWQWNDVAYDFSKPVTSDLTLTAIYKPVVVSHTVTFNSAGGTVIPSQTIKNGDPVIQPEDPEKDGFTFVEWQWNDVAYDFSKPVTSDLTLTAIYEATGPTYTVTFNSMGGTDVPSQIVNSGNLAAQPANPSKEGYTFIEWQLGGATYDFGTFVTSDLTLSAVYKAIGTTVYTVSFDSTGGTAVPSQNINKGDPVAQPEAPVKEGYNFIEWRTYGVAYDFSKPVMSNLTLFAFYEPIYTVTFDSTGGTAVPSQTVNKGTMVAQPDAPVKEGYTFVEWRTYGVAYDFSKPVTSNLTLFAFYKLDEIKSGTGYTVTFDSTGGTNVPSQTVNKGNLVAQPDAPVKEGYTFVEWRTYGVAYDFSKPVTSNFTLYAFYKPDDMKTGTGYTVIFDSTGGTNVPSQTIGKGSLVAQPDAPVKEGYNFVEWRTYGVAYDFSKPVTSNFTLYAFYEPIYTVTFDSTGGTSVPSQTVDKGGLIAQPEAPVKEGYTFVEWRTYGVAYDFNKPVTSNLTLFAFYR